MAASYNKVILMGNLTRDPDLRYLPNGSGVCELGIAVNRRYTNSAGQEIDEPCFVDVVVWGKSAENCKQYLEKGSQVMIEGRLQLDQWEDRNGGGKRSKLRVVAEQIQFLNRRNPNAGGGYDGGNGSGAPQYGNAPQQAPAYGTGNGGNNYSAPQQRYGNNGGSAVPRGFQPRQNSAPQSYDAPQQRPQTPPQMPLPPQQQSAPVPPPEQPPMPNNAFNPDDAADDDIPF